MFLNVFEKRLHLFDQKKKNSTIVKNSILF